MRKRTSIRGAGALGTDKRAQDLKSDGVEVEYHHFKNAGHGFGLGKGSDADGWMEQAIAFWGKHLK